MDKQIAMTILKQIGGTHFRAMTGANCFVSHNNGLSFKLPGKGFAKDSINFIQVTLDPSDTYTMTFSRTRGMNVKVIHEYKDIYCDQLQELFTKTTGLETHL